MRKILLFSILTIAIVFEALDGFSQEQQNKTNYYSFGGHVFTGDFPIELGYARLYNYGEYTPIDTAIIDTLGYYYFYRKPEGKYIVMAFLDKSDPNYGSFAATYYPSTVIWEEAEVIDLKETSWEYDISLHYFETETIENGPGKISGTIQVMNSKPIAENIDVMLCDENLNFLGHRLTNNMGEFLFENLSFGDYVLYPQVIGLTTIPISISITENQSQYTGIEVSIKDGFIASYINESIVKANSFMLYPNPNAGLLNIAFEVYKAVQVKTRIFDLSGRLVYEYSSKTNIGMNKQEINTVNWKNAYYFCDILIDGQSAIHQKIAIIH